MKVSDFFKKKYLGYELIVYGKTENDMGYSTILDFYIKNSKVNYVGLLLKEDREIIDTFIKTCKDIKVIDYDFDKDTKQVFLYQD